ncbi:UNVERIFIED_CONTAM: hypothetical protein Sradi_5827200 [Sesamum radiatum]|uniref:Transposase n=1 Tax=Sesamum radiatum TaxID=300843 RepID=A0AAW2KPE4_SESRA
MYELGIMYEQCAGKKGTMNFNYKGPGLPLELGLRRINNECPDICICDLENQYRGLDLPIEIYVEEIDCEPIQALDQEGNVVSTQQEEEMRCLLDGVNFGDDLGFTAPRGDGERGVFDIEYVKNEKVRVTAKCKIEGCNWRIHASPAMNDCFQIKTIQGAHTCARIYDNKLAKASYLAKRMESAIRDHPIIPVLQLKNTILRKCKVDVSRQKVQRAKREALEKIRGADSVQYEKLWDYCETVRKFNSGSKLILKKLEGSNPPIFDKMYVCLSALKNGFLSGCRPIIGLNGCFLKTCYGGQLLVAVGRDGNDNMFPIAMAVVQLENRKNWTWFLGELLDDIGGLGTSIWSFISDRQKGLIEALKDLGSDSEHRFCLRHMYENFKIKFKSQELKEFFWKAASTANESDFERYMRKINELDPKKNVDVETASEWLRKINLEHWVRAFFPLHSKCDILVNNICESFNNYILDARDKPIITMLEWIRTKLMIRLQQQKGRDGEGISHEEILVEGSQIPPASQEHELQSEAIRGTKVEQRSVGSSAATHPTSTPPSSNVQTSIGSSAAKHPISTHPSTQEIGCQGPRNDASMGGRSRGSGGNTSRNKTPSISQVLERIKERSKKRPWRP